MIQNVQLKDIATVAAGQGAPQGAHNYSHQGIPFIKAGDLADLIAGKNESDVQKVSEEVAKKHRLKLFPKGTILFAKSGMSCMKGYVYTLQSDCYVVSHLACITPHNVSSEYLRYYFEYHRPNSLVKDSAYPSISLADISNLSITVPDEDSCLSVVRILNSVNALIAKKRKILELLDHKFQ